MSGIALTKSKHLLPYAALLHSKGVPVRPLLKKANLVHNCLDDPNNLVPSICGGIFRELAAQATGSPNISLEACQHLEVERLDFGQALLMEPTVAAAINTFCRLVACETSNASFELCPQPNGDLWFGERIQTAVNPGEWHVTLYVLSWMLKIARLADPTWSPAKIMIASKATPEHFEAIEKLGSTARLEQNCTGFLVPVTMLALPVRRTTAQGQVMDGDFRPSVPAETYAGSIKQLIQSYDTEGWLNIDQLSEVTGTNVRTLQRRLWTEQETWSSLVQQCRAEKAGGLLENTDAPILEIANQVGYKNQGHFSRAFQRWAKLSPREFRQQRSRSL
jgi:AraC-like DNA-binding protein